MARETFISHRHGDSAIAEVVRTHLQLWNIPEDEIFQSSHAHSGVRIGDNLNESLSSQLKESKLVILIYTFADLDWSYCMWECGVATDPEKEKRTLLFCNAPQTARNSSEVKLSSGRTLRTISVDLLFKHIKTQNAGLMQVA